MFEPPPFHPDRPDLVAPVRIDKAGETGPTSKQARGPRWRRTSQGFYVPSTAPTDSVEQRIVEAAAVLKADEAVTGWAGLRWLKAYWFTGTSGANELLAVPLLVQRHIVPQPLFQQCQDHLRPEQIVVIDGLPITIAVRSLAHEMRFAPSLWQAVTALDLACYSDLVSITEAAAYAETLGTWTGIPQMREALPLADENAWSPTEVSLRRVWTDDAGKPRPLCNRPVFDLSGRHIGTPDVIDPVSGVLGQYDGSVHLVGSQRHKDVDQEAAYRRLGLECVVMMAADLAAPHGFVNRLNEAYARAERRPLDQRGWTIVPPAWWVPTHKVELRRQLSARDRDRLLRYRRSA